MKNSILFLAIAGLLISFFSCKNDSVTEAGNNLTALTTISGNVENWTLGSRTIKLRINGWNGNLDTIAEVSTINADGSFTFNNLPTPTARGISIISFPSDTNCSENVTINPNGLKVGFAYICVYYNADSILGTLTKASAANYSNNGFIQLYHIYFSAAGSITGNDNCNFTGVQTESSYNANFPAKWYYLVERCDSLGFTHYKYTINSTEPSGLKWYYRNSIYFDKKPVTDKRSFIK